MRLFLPASVAFIAALSPAVANVGHASASLVITKADCLNPPSILEGLGIESPTIEIEGFARHVRRTKATESGLCEDMTDGAPPAADGG